MNPLQTKTYRATIQTKERNDNAEWISIEVFLFKAYSPELAEHTIVEILSRFEMQFPDADFRCSEKVRVTKLT